MRSLTIEPAQVAHVAEEDARRHAALALLREAAVDTPSMLIDAPERLPWRTAVLGAPRLVFDLSTEPLAYAYPVLSGGGQIFARLWIAATPLAGAMLLTMECAPTIWPIAEGMQRACSEGTFAYPGWIVERIVPVMHDLPRTGVLARMRDPNSRAQARIVIDLAEFQRAPILREDAESDGELEGEAYPSWSLLNANRRADEEAARARWQADLDSDLEMFKAFEDMEQDPIAWLAEGRSLADLRDLERVLDHLRRADGCMVHVAPVRAYFKANVGYCTIGVGRMIASKYGFYHAEQHVAGMMGVPYPKHGGSKNWATCEKELNYYRMSGPAGLGKVGSKAHTNVPFLSDWKNYLAEVKADQPANLRKWSCSSMHHSRCLAGIRVCNGGATVQLGYLDPMHKETTTKQPQYWTKFDAQTSGTTVGSYLQIGGLVAVKD